MPKDNMPVKIAMLSEVASIRRGYSPVIRRVHSSVSREVYSLTEGGYYPPTNRRDKDYSSVSHRVSLALSKQEKEQQPDRDYYIPFIRPIDLQRQLPLDIERIHWLNEKDLNAKTMRLKPGDILLLSHGIRFTTAVIPAEMSEAICASLFIIIRLTASNILPEYVCWFLGLPKTINQLRRRSVGSAMQFIPRNDLGQLEFPVPNIDVQRKIIKIKELQIRERELTRKLLAKRQMLTDAVLKDMTLQQK